MTFNTSLSTLFLGVNASLNFRSEIKSLVTASSAQRERYLVLSQPLQEASDTEPEGTDTEPEEVEVNDISCWISLSDLHARVRLKQLRP